MTLTQKKKESKIERCKASAKQRIYDKDKKFDYKHMDWTCRYKFWQEIYGYIFYILTNYQVKQKILV